MQTALPLTESKLAAPRRSNLATSGTKKALLDRFQRELDASERTAPMNHSYQRIDPYIIESDQAGYSFSLIIYNIESELWYAGENWFDWSFLHLHEHHLIKNGDVIFDIGCNSGFTTCWYALATGSEGKVHAFDPFPWNAISTRYSAELNGLSHVTVHQIGIGATDERIKLSLADSKISSHHGPHVIDAQIHPLSYYRKLRPNVLKIDIEGAEYELSQADFSTFKDLRFCFLELHPEFIEARGVQPQVCLQNFLQHGFEARRHPADARTIYDGSAAAATHGGYYLSRTLPPVKPKRSQPVAPALRGHLVPAGQGLLRQAFHRLPSPVQATVRQVVAPLRAPHLVQQLRATVVERECAIREREATTRIREARIAELEHLVRARDAMLCERDQEREATARIREARIVELEHLVRARDAMICEREMTTTVREQRIIELERILGRQDASIVDASEGIAAQEAAVGSPAARSALNARIVAAMPAIEGWCTERKAVWLAGLIADNGCRRVLEIGIFGGKSLIPIALAVQQGGPGGKVYGIEAWNGEMAVETPTSAHHDAWWRSVDFKVIKTGFLRNVLANDLADIVNVFEMSSDAAYKCLTAIGLQEFDLIHVDGSHSEVQALRDVKTWSALLRPDGILVMDDIGWPTVQPARDYAKSNFAVIEEVFETERVAYGAYRRRP